MLESINNTSQSLFEVRVENKEVSEERLREVISSTRRDLDQRLSGDTTDDLLVVLGSAMAGQKLPGFLDEMAEHQETGLGLPIAESAYSSLRGSNFDDENAQDFCALAIAAAKGADKPEVLEYLLGGVTQITHTSDEERLKTAYGVAKKSLIQRFGTEVTRDIFLLATSLVSVTNE